MSLYLLINIFSILIPLVLSFDKRVHFYSYWKYLIPAMVITLALFIMWDVAFTAMGVWGFNERYHSPLNLLGLPLEEFLFFISVPYASIFTLYVIDSYFPKFKLTDSQVRLLSFILIAAFLTLGIIHIKKAYTAVNFIVSALVIGLVWVRKPEILRGFFVSYLVILIPFGVVNGILTGSFIDEQVVWYNDQENLGIRLGTIPLEDFLYGMTLILLNYFLMETFRSRSQRKNKVSV
jgi:lycopene cyclase domain-containing protein